MKENLKMIRNTKKSDCHIYAKIEDKVKFIENNRILKEYENSKGR